MAAPRVSFRGMTRLSLLFMKLLAGAAALFGIFYLLTAVKTLRAGEWAATGILALFGIAGIALGIGLWRGHAFITGRAPNR